MSPDLVLALARPPMQLDDHFGKNVSTLRRSGLRITWAKLTHIDITDIEGTGEGGNGIAKQGQDAIVGSNAVVQ